MQYVLLIYTPEPTEEVPREVLAAEMAKYNVVTDHMRERGALIAGEALDSVTTATTVRVVDGKTLTTDGPFVGMKEAVGGWFILEADNLDAAIEVASRVPAARYGGAVEIRPSEVYW